MLTSSNRDTPSPGGLAGLSFWLFVLLPASLYAGNRVCGGYVSPNFHPFDSPCFAYVELFDDDALTLIGVSEGTPQDYFRVVARSTRIDVQNCTEDELELFEGADNSAVSRQLILYERPIYVKDGLCKVRSTWLMNLDESWQSAKEESREVSVSLPIVGSGACNGLTLEDFVNLRSDIPDQAVVAILRQSEAILRDAAGRIGGDSARLCIRSLGVDAPEPSSRQYVLEIAPTAHEVFVRFRPDFESEVTLVRKKGR